MISTPARHLRLLSIALVIFVALGAANRARADKDDEFKKTNPKVLAAFRQVVARASESTVRVRSDGTDVALGTVVAADGLIVTKASELKGSVKCRLKDGRELDATIIGMDDVNDLAMLKVDAKDLKPVEWRESKTAAVGDWVAAPGLGSDPVAVGVVSVATRKGSDKPRFTPNPKSGFLGIALPQNDDPTPRIEEIIPNTAAEKAKLKKGDVILAIDGETVKDAKSVPQKLGKYHPDDVVTLKIRRGDEEREFKVKLGKRPADRSDVQNHMGGDLSDRRTGFPTFLQHDAVLKPTDCGGPLVDLDGKVVGINIARAGRVESYALPAEVVQRLVPDFVSGKLAANILEKKLKELRGTLAKFEDDHAALDRKIAAAQKEKEELEKALERKIGAAQKEKAELEKKIAQARENLKKTEAEASTKAVKDDKKSDKQPEKKDETPPTDK